jgi:hypothetical protein
MKWLLCSAFVIGCVPLQQTGTSEAEIICEQYRRLSCVEGYPTPKGTTCEQVLEGIQASGIALPNRACVARAVSCEQALTCE